MSIMACGFNSRSGHKTQLTPNASALGVLLRLPGAGVERRSATKSKKREHAAFWRASPGRKLLALLANKVSQKA